MTLKRMHRPSYKSQGTIHKNSAENISLVSIMIIDSNEKTSTMEYNTKLTKLPLPEYGRNIQNMVNHCMTIEDRNERNICAQTIINTMANLFPQMKDLDDFKHILWDHLAIMSNFSLDIDYPFEIIKRDKLNTVPGKIEYSSPAKIRFMHYGKIIHELIDKASSMEEGEELSQLEEMIANFMKRSYTNFNKEGVEDVKIFDDLEILSKGKIRLHEKNIKLAEYKAETKNTTSKKKKKK